MSQEEQKVPTHEEIVKFLEDQIVVKKLQAELGELAMKIAISKAEELKAFSFIGSMTNPKDSDNTPYEGGVPHTITQEDLDNNPEMVDAGLVVGDEVMLPKQEESKKRTLKKK